MRRQTVGLCGWVGNGNGMGNGLGTSDTYIHSYTLFSSLCQLECCGGKK